MKIHIGTDGQIAAKAAERYKKLLSEKPNAVLGFATGSTPLLLYAELIRLNKAGKLSFKKAVTFNLDEYVGLNETNEQSYRCFMNRNLFEQIDIPMRQTHVPQGRECTDEQGAAYDNAIETAGGIDLQLLGIGNNGHIGFNEPGTPFGTMTHTVVLTPSTRLANARFFRSVDDVPAEAVSMGIKTVMHARSIILIAEGEAKAQAIRDAFCGPVTEAVPASVLQLHPDVELYLDPEAAKLL